MASSSKMQSPVSPRKSKIDTFKECIASTVEDLDTKMTSCLYYISKDENKQATESLERIRRLFKSSHGKYSFLINEISLDLSALKQKNDGLQKREKYLSEKNAELQRKIEYYKTFITFDDEFETDDDLTFMSSQEANSSSQETTAASPEKDQDSAKQ